MGGVGGGEGGVRGGGEVAGLGDAGGELLGCRV